MKMTVVYSQFGEFMQKTEIETSKRSRSLLVDPSYGQSFLMEIIFVTNTTSYVVPISQNFNDY